MEYEIYRSDDELYHHGIKGMRWGIRRYQTKDGSLTPAGRKRYDNDMAKVKAETKKLRAQQRTAKKLSKLDEAKKKLADLKAAKKKGGKEEAPEETDEQKKERILKAPSAKDVYENRHLFSNTEISNLATRIQNEENIRKNIPQQIDAGKARADKFFSNVETATARIQTLSKAYNSVANIVNAFADTPISLPKIETDNTKGNKVTRAEEKKKLDEKEAAEKQAKQEAKQAKKEAKQAKKEAKAAAKAEKAAAKEVENTESSKRVVTKPNVTTGKTYVQKQNDTVIDTSKYPNDQEWKAFTEKYSWGREPYAVDRVDD